MKFIKYYGASGRRIILLLGGCALKSPETSLMELARSVLQLHQRPNPETLKNRHQNVYYRVFGFPLRSMNQNLCTQDKLSAVTVTLG